MIKISTMLISSSVIGLGLGSGIIGWMLTHPSVRSVSLGGGLVVLDTSTTPTPTPSGSLEVYGPLAVAAGGGQSRSLLGQNTGSAVPLMPSPTSREQAPPIDFSSYEKYRQETHALFADVVVGTGKPIVLKSQVSVQYRGYLTNGTVFDESYARNQPFVFTEGAHRVIMGFEEGLYGMKAGGKRRLVIPPASGYGATVQGAIPANSVLVFDVELIAVDDSP